MADLVNFCYVAPPALVEHCSPPKAREASNLVGTYEFADVKMLYSWMADNALLGSDDDWFRAGMAAKIEFGDRGLELWKTLATRKGELDSASLNRWNSFSTEPTSTSVTIRTFMQRAHAAGWASNIRPSRFQPTPQVQLAQLAANAGASLPSGGAGSLIGSTHRIIGNQAEPYLVRFFEAIHDVPFNPARSNYPQLPENLAELYPTTFELTNEAIKRIVVMAETPRTWRQQRAHRILGILSHMHGPTYQGLVDYIHSRGCTLSADPLTSAAKEFEKEINAGLNASRTTFHGDSKGKPDPAISDNVGIFLSLSDHRARWDSFSRQIETAHGEETFKRLDQNELDYLWTMAKSVDYNYHPSQELFLKCTGVLARENQFDSLEDEVQRLDDVWDGVPRLDTWLTQTCNVPADPYHKIVGLNLIGGMIKRARDYTPGKDGAKHDETVIFISPEQGTGKSSICRLLARRHDWFLGKFKFGQSDQSSLPLLSGKWIVELGELAGLNKTDFEDVKTFLSDTKDEYVAKYEVLPTLNPRRCIFVGTSNNRQPLGDPSGNRRFLPVQIDGEINLDWLRDNVDQLIGEAARRHGAGEQFGVPKDFRIVTGEAQEAARSMTAVEEAIHDWFDRPEGAFHVLAGDIGRALKMMGLLAQSRYGVYLEKIGWRHHSPMINGRKVRVWTKGDWEEARKTCLEPIQRTVNGRVMFTGAVPPCPIPPPLPRIPGRT